VSARAATAEPALVAAPPPPRLVPGERTANATPAATRTATAADTIAALDANLRSRPIPRLNADIQPAPSIGVAASISLFDRSGSDERAGVQDVASQPPGSLKVAHKLSRQRP
jgi:hypothetical protein